MLFIFHVALNKWQNVNVLPLPHLLKVYFSSYYVYINHLVVLHGQDIVKNVLLLVLLD